MNLCMHGRVCEKLLAWITVCMVTCAHRFRIKRLQDASIAYLLKKKSILTLCAHATMHAVIHACSCPCTRQCTQKSMHAAMHANMNTSVWMEVYVNQASILNTHICVVDNEKDKYPVNQNAINHFRLSGILFFF